MKAMDLVKRMEALRPDSLDELDLINEAANVTMRIWREYADVDSHDAYYRIRISGRDGIICELLPDRVTATMGNLQMYTVTDAGNDSMVICGCINATDCKVVGE